MHCGHYFCNVQILKKALITEIHSTLTLTCLTLFVAGLQSRTVGGLKTNTIAPKKAAPLALNGGVIEVVSQSASAGVPTKPTTGSATKVDHNDQPLAYCLFVVCNSACL